MERLRLTHISLAREYLAKALNYWVWSLLILFEKFANSCRDNWAHTRYEALLLLHSSGT